MKIYVLGDSISIHYGPFLQKYVQGIFDYARKEGEEEALLNLDQPMGANGGDSSMVLKFLQFKHSNEGISSDLILINCGLHDIKANPKTGERQIDTDTYQSNLRAIITLIASMQLQLIWIRTTPCNDAIHNRPESLFYRYAADVDHYNQIADQVMAEHQIPSIDLYQFTENLGPDLYCDHIHFNESIHEKQAAFIAGWLNRFID